MPALGGAARQHLDNPRFVRMLPGLTTVLLLGFITSVFHDVRRRSISSVVVLGALVSTLFGPGASAVEPVELNALFVDSTDWGTTNGRIIDLRSPDDGLLAASPAISSVLPGDGFNFDINPTDDAANGAFWNLYFMAPVGQVLSVGTYQASHDINRESGMAALVVQAQGVCASTGGTFTVHDVAFDPSTGQPTRFAATFAQDCISNSIVGEIRYRSSVPMTSRRIDPIFISTELVQVGSVGADKVITVSNTGTTSITVTNVARTGPFRLVDDGCTGPLPAGQACTIRVASEPTGPGSTVGGVIISDTSLGSPRTVSLAGSGKTATTTTLTSSTNPNITNGDPSTLTAVVSPTPDSGFVDFCVVGGACLSAASLGNDGIATLTYNYATPTRQIVARFRGRPHYDASESLPLTQATKFRPRLDLRLSQTSGPPGHPLEITADTIGSIPGGTLTLTDELTGEILTSRQVSDPGIYACDAPTEPGMHRYRLDYSGYGDDWVATSTFLDLIVGTGPPVLPARIPSGNGAPTYACTTIGSFAPYALVNDPIVRLQPWATTNIILTHARVSNSPDVTDVNLLVHGVDIAYGEAVDWSLIDPNAGGIDADGEKWVYVQFFDDAGRHGYVGQWSFRLDRSIPTDTTPPIGSVSIDGGAAFTASASVMLAADATDGESGLSLLALSNDGNVWITRPYAANQTWKLPATNGTRTVYAKWQDVAGNWSGVSTDSIILDTIAPSVTAPRRGFVTKTALNGGSILTRIPWSGSDVGSGIVRYELDRQTDASAWSSVSATLTSPVATPALATEHTYRFRVRAVDQAGNVGAWSYGDTFRVSRFSEGNSRILYSGTWSTSKASVFWGGVAKASSKAGSRASITFTGRSVAWVSSMGPTRGKADVYVNGVKVATVDLYSATSKHQQVVWTGSWTTAGSRTITIRVQGTSGRPRIDLDAFVTAN